MKEKFISTKELSKRTGVAEQTYCNDRAKKIGYPYYRKGRRIFYDWDEVLEIIRSSRIQTNN